MANDLKKQFEKIIKNLRVGKIDPADIAALELIKREAVHTNKKHRQVLQIMMGREIPQEIDDDFHNQLLDVARVLNKIKTAWQHDMPEKSGKYFITGELGDKDGLGLPQCIMICPMSGLNGFAVYEKVRDYSEPGY